SDSEPKKKKLKKKKKKRHRSTSSEESARKSSSSENSQSSDEERKKKLKKKRKKEKKKKAKEEKRKLKKLKKAAEQPPLIGPALPGSGGPIGPAIPAEILAGVKQEEAEGRPRMAPMTKEEWEKRQSVVRRVYDEATGRHRLIKGDGEVLEEIVSRDRHLEINRQATLGDGLYFQSKLPNR
ncbi:unnamed protein product, partial [Nesidiocoris tenuis]